MARPRTTEPLWWALFSAGGMISAMTLPVLIVVTGILVPAGAASDAALAYDRVHALVAHPLSRLVLFAVIALPLYHWAHRFLYTLVELGLRRYRHPLATICYTSAVAGTLITAAVLWWL
jgi:fumarate reductase subunit D